MNVGKTLFVQIMEFVPWTSFARIVQRHSGNAGVRTLNCTEQFLRAMAFSQLTWRESLRDVKACLSANASKLYATIGFSSPVKRSTLADANERCDWRILADLVAVLIRRARKLYASEPLGVELEGVVYALDSSTIDLCLNLFGWAPFRSTKAAIKLHTLLDLCGAIPAFIHISDGKLHDVNVLDMLTFGAGAFFVTRAKKNMDAQRVYSAPCEHASGVICDQRVRLAGHYPARKYPEHLRRIRFKDPESGKTLVFLTNNTSLPALTIAALYTSRWQVELFFKWIKQHLRIKKFLGTSENVVKTQIWCAVATYVLIAIVKEELHLDASLYTCLQILSVSVFEKTELSCTMQPDEMQMEPASDAKQLILFDF